MRTIERIIRGRAVSDGAGVDIRRVVGLPGADYIDPFLMFDDFRNDDPKGYVAGFPPHPHRGFETVTYMLKGKMRHQDSNGNSGVLADGAVQWMTAGKGILHSEMPEQTDGSLWGFQIWLNLPQRLQMSEPKYQDIPADAITVFSDTGVDYRLVAGELFGHRGPAETHLPTLMVDVSVLADPRRFRSPMDIRPFYSALRARFRLAERPSQTVIWQCCPVTKQWLFRANMGVGFY